MASTGMRTAGKVERLTRRSDQLIWQRNVVEALSTVTEWLFVAIIAVLPMDAYVFVPGSQSGLFLSEALAAQACLVLGVGYLFARAWHLSFPLSFAPKLLVPLGLLLGASLISLSFAHSRTEALRECAQYAFFFAIFVLAVAVARQPRMRNRVFWAIVTGYYVVVLLGLLGVLSNLPDIAQIVLNVQRTDATLPGSITPRAESTFRFPDELNAYLLLVLPFLAACAFTVRSRFERTIYTVYVALGVWLLFLTYARSALIIAVLITPLLLYFLGGLRVSLIGSFVVICGAGAFVLRDANLATRSTSLLDLHNSGYTSRLLTWKWALTAFAHHPIFGMGPRNLQFFPGAPIADAFRHRVENNGENSYINTLADLGLVGFSALMLCVVTGVRRLWSGMADRTTGLSRSWHVGFLIGCCALLLDSFVHPTFTSTQVTALLCAFVGLAGPYPQAAEERSTIPHLAAVIAARHQAVGQVQAASVLASRVVFLVNAPGYGGAQQHSINLATDLHRRGARVLVVCPPHSLLATELTKRGIPHLIRDLGMPVGRLKGVLGTLSYFFDPLARIRLERCILKLASEEQSIFVCPFPREQLLATPLCRQLGVPIIWGIHAPMSYLPHRLLLRPLWHRRAREATAIFTVSEEFTWRLASGGFPADRLAILRNAVQQEAIIPEDDTSPVPYRLVIVSRLTKRKGIQYALRALPRILAQYPDAHLQIAGSGRYLQALRGEARRLGVAKQVQFLGYQSDPLSILSSASIVLCPSVDDGEVLPTSILEAFGAGVPVVASEIASIPEIVRPGDTGLLVRAADPQALADAVCILLADPERAHMLGSRGRALVRRAYTFEQVGLHFVRILQHLEAGGSINTIDNVPLSESAEVRAVHGARLIGNTGLFVVAKVLTALATALWTVLAARRLTPAAYGDLMLAASLVELGGIITNAGVTTVATRELAAARDTGELPRLMSALIYLKLVLGIVAMMVTVAVGFALPFDGQTHLLLIALGPGLIYVSLNSLTLVFRAQMLFPVTVRIAFIVAAVNTFATLLVFALAPTALGFALADMGASVIAGLVTLVLVFRHARPEAARIGTAAFRAQLARARNLVASAVLLGVWMAVSIFYVRIDVPLLALLTNSTQVAVYTSAYRIIDMVSLLPVSAAGVALPLLVTLQRERREHLRAFAQQYLDVAVVCGLFIAFLLTLVGREAITLLYGGRYAAAEPVLLVLGWASAAMFVTNVFSPISVALDHRRALALSAALGLVANIGLNLLLIPRFGPIGPAWSTLVTELVVTTPLALVAMRDLRWRPDLYTIAAAIEATGAALVSTVVTRSMPELDSVVIAILIWVAALMILAPAWTFALIRSLTRFGGRSAPTGRVLPTMTVPHWEDDDA